MSKVTREMAEAESIHRNMIAARSDVPKLLVQRTEAEWREEFEKWHKTVFILNGEECVHEMFEVEAWLTALRLVGAIKEDAK